MRYRIIDSPLGPLTLAGRAAGLQHILFARQGQPAPRPAAWIREDSGFESATHQLREYFAGELRDFTLQLDPQITDFHAQVLTAMRRIRFGQTSTYGALARELGRPNAARAVGGACARNPLPIVIPCHRVIGSRGKLTGFAAGLDAKTFLLQHEQRQ